MSRTIDERIVQMTFNNKDFERNAKESISTLEKLNKAVDPNAFQSGLNTIEKSAIKFDLNPITKSIQTISDSFGIFESIALGALMNIGKKASDLGIQLVKSLTIDQIANAWQKYGAAIASEQTIMSAVAGKINEATGEVYDIDSITDRISKLQWYTDETSYNISQMTNAIGSFTSSGIDLDIATQAIMGISNACADAGVDASKAESAFYGFAKAIGANEMSLSIWNNQLKTSGLTNSERFKQSLIDAAVEVGTLQKVADGMYKTTSKNGGKSGLEVTVANIGEAFKSGQWANSEVMIKALNSYSDTVDRIYEMANGGEYDTASEAIAALTDEYTRMGKEVPKSLAAFTRAQEAISLEQAVQSAKDAVSSKWSQTFELIFGNYEEAKDLWTTLANEMWEWFASGGDIRNEVLTQWHNGMSEFDRLLESEDIESLIDKNERFKEQIKSLASDDIFSNAIAQNKNAVEVYTAMVTRNSKTIGEAISSIYKSQENLSNLEDIFGSEKTKNSVQELIDERDKLLESEEDEIEKLKLIEDYNIKIGNILKTTSAFRNTAAQVGEDGAFNTESVNKRLEVYNKISEALKAEKVDTDALINLWKDESSRNILSDLLANSDYDSDKYKDLANSINLTLQSIDSLDKSSETYKADSEALYKELANLTTQFSNLDEIAKQEGIVKVINDFYSAIESKDADQVFKVWSEGFKDIEAELGDALPSRIKNLQSTLDNLTNNDVFKKKIKELNDEIENSTGWTKTNLEKQKEFYEGLAESIKTDSIIDFYKNNKKAFEEQFKDQAKYKNILNSINEINKNTTYTEQQKEALLNAQYEKLNDQLKAQSLLDDATKTEKELREEINNFFIKGTSGYLAFVNSVKNILSNITGILGAIKAGIRDLFPTVKPSFLIDLTQSFEDFTEKILLSEEQLEKVQGFVKRLLSPIKLITDAVGILYSSFIKPLGERLKPVLEDVVWIIDGLATSIFKISDAGENKGLAKFQSFLESMLGLLEPLIDILKTFTHWIGELITGLNRSFKNAADIDEEDNSISILAKFVNRLKDVFETLRDIVTGAEPAFKTVKKFLTDAWDFISGMVKNFTTGLSNALGENGLNAVGLGTFFFALQEFMNFKWTFEQNQGVFSLFDTIKKIFLEPKKVVETIHTFFTEIRDTMYGLSDYIGSMWNESLSNGLKNMGIGFLAIAGAVWILASIDQEALNKAITAVMVIGGLMAAMMKLMSDLSKAKVPKTGDKGLGGMLSKFANMFTESSAALNIISISIAVIGIAAALKMLSGINDVELTNAFFAFIGILTALYTFLWAINKLEQKNISVTKGLLGNQKASVSNGGALQGLGKTILSMSIGLIAISYAVKVLADIGDPKVLWSAVGALGVIIAVIGAFFVLVTKFSEVDGDSKTFTRIGKSILTMSIGLLVISGAIKLLSGIPAEGIVIAISGLSVIMLALYLFMRGLASIENGFGNNKSLLKISASILILGVALKAIAKAMSTMGKMSFEELVASLGSLSVLLLEIFLFMKGMSGIGSGSGMELVAMSAGMLIFGGALIAMSAGLGAMALIPIDKLMGVITAIGLLMLAITGIGYLLGSNGLAIAGILAMSFAFLSMGAAVMMVGIGLNQLLPLLLLLTTQTTEISNAIGEVLITAFTTILSLIPAFVMGLVNGIMTFIDVLAQAMLLKIPDLAVSVMGMLITFLYALSDVIKSEAYGLGQAIGAVEEALVEGFWKFLIGAIGGMFGGLIEWFTGEYPVEAMDAFAEAAGEDTANKQAASYTGTFGSKENEANAKEAGEKLGYTAASSMEDTETAETSAQNTIEGAYNKFMSEDIRNMMKDAGYADADWYWKGYNERMDQHSPSREAGREARFTVMGLINGFMGMIPDVKTAGTLVADALADSISIASEMADDILDSGINPVITPVLDLSAIQNGAGSISSMLDTGASYRAALAVNGMQTMNGRNQNGVINNPVINVDFTVNEAGGRLSNDEISKFGKQIADEANIRLGKMLWR